MNITGNTVLITGAGSGIGFELAKLFVQNNNKVIICGRNGDKLRAASLQLDNCTYITCDITNKDDVDRLVKTVTTSFPDLNIIINNAGVAFNYGLSIKNSFYEKATEEINTNYLSIIRLTELFVPSLLKQSSAAIVNISSATALVPSPYLPTYSASKAAIHSYSQTLRFALKNTSIKVFEVLPPLVDTDFASKLKSEKKISAANVANVIVKAISKNKYQVNIGIIKMLNLINRLLPAAAQSIINKSVQ